MRLLRPFRATDRALYGIVHRRLRARALDPVMVAATDVGTKSAAWLSVCAVLALLGNRRERKTAIATAAAVLSAQGVVNMLLKPTFRRERPFLRGRLRSRLLVAPPQESSWPSGHAASSAAAVTTLVAAYPERAVPLMALGLAISYSRVYVGVHYPFDVAAGTSIGLAIGTGYVILTRQWE
jgi:membrane-associated phospholipid phosphatase